MSFGCDDRKLDKMTKQETKPDFYSGIPWVYVPADQARAHPKGKLNLLLGLIAAYFILGGLVRIYLTIEAGYGMTGAALSGGWFLLTGIGLALRAPYSVLMAATSAGLAIFTVIKVVGSDGSLFILFETIANVGILFYLVDGDRPNFVYRHRYRKYSVVDEGAKE